MKLKRYNFTPNCIINVGAYQGDWPKTIKAIFPTSKVLMVEALNKETFLTKVSDTFSDVYFSINVFGSTTGVEKTFYECETGSSYFKDLTSAEKQATIKRTITLDDLLSKLNFDLKYPSLLKIDSQGSELAILTGTKHNLRCFEFIYLEVPIVEYNLNAPRFETYINYMSEIGFRIFDVSTHHIHRDVLIQLDIVFARKTSDMAGLGERLTKSSV